MVSTDGSYVVRGEMTLSLGEYNFNLDGRNAAHNAAIWIGGKVAGDWQDLCSSPDQNLHFHGHGAVSSMTPSRSRITVFSLLILGACSQPWPTGGEEQVQELLARGPQGLQCWDSAWMKANKERNYPYFSDSDECKKSLSIIEISSDEERATGVARCRIGSVDAEYKLSIFRSSERNDYYGGYFCTKAQGENLGSLPVGSVTDAEGAM